MILTSLFVFAGPIVIDMEAFSHSTAAYQGMARTDPKAVWVFQTWSWLGSQAQG